MVVGKSILFQKDFYVLSLIISFIKVQVSFYLLFIFVRQGYSTVIQQKVKILVYFSKKVMEVMKCVSFKKVQLL